MIYKLLFLLWLGVIVFFSVVSRNGGYQALFSRLTLTESGFFLHAAGFFVLGVLAYKAFETRKCLFSLGGVLLLALLLEAVQCLLSTRAFNMTDIAANGLGAAAAFVVCLFLKKEGVRHDA